MKMKIKRSVGTVLANRNTEIAEIIIKLFSFRLLFILTLPLFSDYLMSQRSDGAALDGPPYVMIVVVLIALVTWLYGFFYDKLKWRKWGMGISMFLHTFTTIGLLFSDPGNPTWTIYFILAFSSVLVYTRLKQDLNEK